MALVVAGGRNPTRADRQRGRNLERPAIGWRVRLGRGHQSPARAGLSGHRPREPAQGL